MPFGYCQDHLRNYLILQPAQNDPQKTPPRIVGGILIDDRYGASTIVLLRQSTSEGNIHITLRLHTEAGAEATLSHRVFGGEHRWINTNSQEYLTFDSALINAFYDAVGRDFSWFEYPDAENDPPFGLPALNQLNITRDTSNNLQAVDGVSVCPALIFNAKNSCYKSGALTSLKGKNNIYLKRGTCSNHLRTAGFHLTATTLTAVLHVCIVALVLPDVARGSQRILSKAPSGLRLEPLIDQTLFHTIDESGEIRLSGAEMNLNQLRITAQEDVERMCVQLRSSALNFSPDLASQDFMGWSSSDDDPEGQPPLTCKGWRAANSDPDDWGGGGGSVGSWAY